MIPNTQYKEISVEERFEYLREYRQDLYYDLENHKEQSEHIWTLIKKVESALDLLFVSPNALIQSKNFEISSIFKSPSEAKQPINSENPQLVWTSAETWGELAEQIKSLKKN